MSSVNSIIANNNIYELVTNDPMPEWNEPVPKRVALMWKRCDSTSTYNDNNYADVRHNYSVGDLISFISYSVFNWLQNITKPITHVTDTAFTIKI